MLGIHLSGRISINNFSFEFRPGFVYDPKDHYDGIEYGFYLRYMFNNINLYLVGGLNVHENFGEGHNFVTVYSNTFILPTISVGYQISKTLGVLISYYNPIEKYKLFKEATLDEGGMDNLQIYTGNLIGVIAIGVDWTF